LGKGMLFAPHIRCNLGILILYRRRPNQKHRSEQPEEMESAVKTTLLLATLAAGVLFVTAAGAGGNAPSQLMPSYPYPSYCEQCFGYWVTAPQRPVIIARQHVERRPLRTDTSEKAPK
jgi:hypothetical protein